MATLIYSQYTDATKTALQAYFGVATDPDHFPQDPVAFPNQCVIASSDPRYITYYDKFTGLFPTLVGVLMKPGT